MFKREVKRFKYKVQKYLDPFAVVGMAMLLILPTLAIFNLSPQSKAKNEVHSNVLGAVEGQPVGIALVGGNHDFIKEESISFPSDGIYQYNAVIQSHEKGALSKPIIQLQNSNDKTKSITFVGTIETPSDSRISLIYKGIRYSLISPTGKTTDIVLEIGPKEVNDVYMEILNLSDVQFDNEVELKIVQ